MNEGQVMLTDDLKQIQKMKNWQIISDLFILEVIHLQGHHGDLINEYKA
jgi:hypothetical protein